MSDEKRPYRKKRRAELEEETRLRITESAIALHGSIGPAHTSMSAVAEHAGVPRSTLYRHFADEDALFEACSAHWNAAHPAPDIGAWAAIADPDDRLRTGLTELYAFYRGGEQMLANLFRDIDRPTVASRFRPFLGYIGAGRDILARGRPRRRAVRAAVGHALAFDTWRSLTRDQELDDAQAVELMVRLVDAAGAS